MKICPKCKKQYDDHQKFCKICGVPLVEAKKKKGIGIYLSYQPEYHVYNTCIGVGEWLCFILFPDF